MSNDRWEDLLERDWSESWAMLPEAPAVVPREKTAQITLRIPLRLLARIKRVAGTRALPYHTLVRSWLYEALSNSTALCRASQEADGRMAQLNIKLDHAALDEIKKRGYELGQPYHRIAREWIERKTFESETTFGLDTTPIQ